MRTLAGEIMTTQPLTLGLTESDLVGNWVERGGRVEGDATCHRIERLVAADRPGSG